MMGRIGVSCWDACQLCLPDGKAHDCRLLLNKLDKGVKSSISSLQIVSLGKAHVCGGQ